MSHTLVISMQAKAFLDAYETLNNSLYQKVQHGNMHSKMPIFERIPVVAPAITCIAFAAEIAIKALIVQTADGSLSACPKNAHNLDELFNLVPSNLQADIASTLKKSQQEVMDNLAKNAKAFVKWRYSYENGAWADEEFLCAFTKAALAQINTT